MTAKRIRVKLWHLLVLLPVLLAILSVAWVTDLCLSTTVLPPLALAVVYLVGECLGDWRVVVMWSVSMTDVGTFVSALLPPPPTDSSPMRTIVGGLNLDATLDVACVFTI